MFLGTPLDIYFSMTRDKGYQWLKWIISQDYTDLLTNPSIEMLQYVVTCEDDKADLEEVLPEMELLYFPSSPTYVDIDDQYEQHEFIVGISGHVFKLVQTDYAYDDTKFNVMESEESVESTMKYRRDVLESEFIGVKTVELYLQGKKVEASTHATFG